MVNTFNERIDGLKMNRILQEGRKHGPINLETDSRNFKQEAAEELIDALNYLEFAMLQGKIGFCKWVSIDRDIRFLIWRLVGNQEKGQVSGDTKLDTVSILVFP